MPVRWKRYEEWSAWHTGQSMNRLRAGDAATAAVGSKTNPPRSALILTPGGGVLDSASDMASEYLISTSGTSSLAGDVLRHAANDRRARDAAPAKRVAYEQLRQSGVVDPDSGGGTRHPCVLGEITVRVHVDR